MATPSYQWTFHGRELTWTGKIFKTGFAGSTTLVKSGAEMRFTTGERTNSFDDRVRASELRFSIIDPDLALYNDLINADNEEGDFTLELTEPTTPYTINMIIRLDEVSVLLADDIEQHITQIYAYCGLAEHQNIDSVILSSSSIHNLMRLILVSNAISQDIEYYTNIYPENVATSGALNDLVWLNRLDLIFAEEGRKIDSMYDQFKSLLEGLLMVGFNGMDGRWHVKHDYGLGETLTDRGAQFFDVSTSILTTLVTLTGSTFNLVNRLISRDSSRMPLKAIQAVQVERGNGRSFFSVDVVRHGDFENGWSSASTHEVWDVIEGSISQSSNADTGNYAFQLDAGSSRADQILTRFAGGYQEIDIEVALRYALESTTASTTKSGASFLVLFYENQATLDVVRGDAGGNWESDTIAGAIALTAGIVADGDSLIWKTLITTINGPLPDFDGRLKLSVQGSLTNFDTILDTVEVRLKSGEDAKMDFRAVSGRYDINGNLIGKGGVVEQKVPFYNGLLGTDISNDGSRDAVYPMIQVLTTPSGSRVQASDFKTYTIGYTSEDYADPFELTSTLRIAQQSTTTETIEGEVLGIVPHDTVLTRDLKPYVQVFTEIDLKREITAYVAHRKVLTVTDQFQPTYLYYGDSNDRLLRAAVKSPGSGLWTAEVVTTLTRDILRGDVDQEAGYWFVQENVSAGGTKLMRYNLDGSGGFEVYDDTSSTLFNFALGRLGRHIYAVIDDAAGGGTAAIRKYDYDGNLVSVVKADTGIQKIQWVGVSPAEDFVYYRRYNSSGPIDQTKSINLSDSSEVTLLTATSLTDSGEINTAVISESSGKLWVLGAVTSDRKIVEIDLPNGGSESDYRSTLQMNPAGINDEGLAINRFLSRIVYNKGAGDLYWNNYGATDEEQVIEGGTGAPQVTFLSFGYN